MTRAIRFLGLGLALLTLVACREQNPQPDQSFSYSVDPALTPSPQVRAGKTLAAAKSAEGLVHLFIEDEILIRPKDDAELRAFLQRTGGTVIGDDRVPEPPPGSGIQLRPEDRVPTLYVVRVEPTRFSLEGFEANAQRAGLRGATVFSGERAARLLAGIVGERVRGLKVSPNFVAEPADVLFRTQEHPLGSGGSFEDALSYPFFSDTGSRSSVALMFQLIAASPPARRAQVAIIDGGFWLNRTGASLSPDLPGTPLQYDFTDNDSSPDRYVADGTNPVPCGGGSSCPWHGTGAAHVAVARLNNRYGAAGTGGQVADAILFKTSFDWGQVSAAIRTAVSWRADVISMSFSASCDNSFCDGPFFEFNLYPALRNARDRCCDGGGGGESERVG
jgi:serine protease